MVIEPEALSIPTSILTLAKGSRSDQGTWGVWSGKQSFDGASRSHRGDQGQGEGPGSQQKPVLCPNVLILHRVPEIAAVLTPLEDMLSGVRSQCGFLWQGRQEMALPDPSFSCSRAPCGPPQQF